MIWMPQGLLVCTVYHATYLLSKLPARCEYGLHLHLPEVFIQLCEVLIALYSALMGVRVSEEAEVEQDGCKLVPWGL